MSSAAIAMLVDEKTLIASSRFGILNGPSGHKMMRLTVAAGK
jgi:hypothetical protein